MAKRQTASDDDYYYCYYWKAPNEKREKKNEIKYGEKRPEGIAKETRRTES